MDEAIAADVVERLRTRRIFAHVNRRAGVYNVGVRVVIPDGREAIWDNDGAAGRRSLTPTTSTRPRSRTSSPLPTTTPHRQRGRRPGHLTRRLAR